MTAAGLEANGFGMVDMLLDGKLHGKPAGNEGVFEMPVNLCGAGGKTARASADEDLILLLVEGSFAFAAE